MTAIVNVMGNKDISHIAELNNSISIYFDDLILILDINTAKELKDKLNEHLPKNQWRRIR